MRITEYYMLKQALSITKPIVGGARLYKPPRVPMPKPAKKTFNTNPSRQGKEKNIFVVKPFAFE